MALILEKFGGMIPKLNPELLPEANGALADGCYLASGKIVPRESHKDIEAVAAGALSIYRRNGKWLSWLTDVDVVKSPVANDAFNRIYISGDGLPKVMGALDGEDKTFTLGVPAPVSAPVVSPQHKDEIRWLRTWQYQYEDPDGTVSQSGALVEGEYGGQTINEVLSGQSYRMAALPAKIAGVSADAVFVAYFDAYTDSDIPTYLGRVYPDISLYRAQTDLYVEGALVSMAQVNGAGAEFSLSFDTSRASDYTKERVYVYTWITAFGEESSPSDPSALVEVSPVQDAIISGLPTVAPEGYPNVVKKRLYRTVTLSGGTIYMMVADVDMAAAEYTDSLFESELLSILDTVDWLPPPDDLKGIGVTSNGVGFGFSGRTVYFSKPYYLHAWPAKYQFEAKSEIVAMLALENGVAVVTKDQPEVIQGDTPESMQRITLPVRQGCVSKRSAVLYRGGMAYATPDGIGMISGLSHTMITDPYFERADWQALGPYTMIGAEHNQELLMYSASASLIAGLKDGQIVSDEGTEPTAFFHDEDEDALYFVQGGRIKQWRGGAESVTATWRSRTFVFSRPSAPISMQVHAAEYPVTVNFYAEGEKVLTLNMLNNKLRKLPVLRRTERWAFETVSAHTIRRITIGTAGGKL